MRYIKIAVLAAFVLGLGLFGTAQIREFMNRDTTMPVIKSEEDTIEIPCAYTQEELLQGITAEDEKDGDLTSQILVGNFSRFIEKGVSDLSYVVFDSSNHPATLTRKVKFTDYHSPRFTLTEPLIYREGEGGYEETKSRLGATDLLDGDLKEWVVQTESDVNYQKAGTYHITFQVENSFGDSSSVALPVHITNNASLLNIQLQSPIVYIQKGAEVNPNAWISGVTDGAGNPLDPAIVTAVSYVDSNTAGCYEIAYNADDGQGNTGETWLTVVVQE